MNTDYEDVNVITEMDVYEATIRRSVRNLESPRNMGSPKASPTTTPDSNETNKDYSWSDAEPVEEKIQPMFQSQIIKDIPTQEKPKDNQPKETQYESPFQEPSLVEKESLKELIEQLMKEIVKDSIRQIKSGVVESVKTVIEKETDDMPQLVEDMNNVTEKPTEEQVFTHEEVERRLLNQSLPTQEEVDILLGNDSSTQEDLEIRDDLMIAIFNQPECPRCAAILKLILSNQNTSLFKETDESNNDNSANEDSANESSDDESNDTSDDSTNDDSTDESGNDDTTDEDNTEDEKPSRRRDRESDVPPLITHIFLILILIYIMKMMFAMTDMTVQQHFRSCPF